MNTHPAYYLLVSGKEYGPYDAADLKAALAENTIESDCLVRAGLSGEWTPVSEVLSHVLESVTPSGLEAIRHNTAYRPLRTLINAAAVVFLLFLFVTLATSAWEAFGHSPKLAALICLQFLGTMIGTLISWGLAIVLIDLADIQLSRR